MAKFHKILLTMVSAAMTMISCAPRAEVAVPDAPFEDEQPEDEEKI